MTTVAMSKDGEYELTPAGTHLGICYTVADLGMQPTMYGHKPKIVLIWELPNEPMADGRPFAVSAMYTLSLSAKAELRKHLESWRGRPFTDAELKGFDVKNVLGKPCTITVVHNTPGERTFANVGSIGGVMKGTVVPAVHNDLVHYDMDKNDQDSFNKLPKWIQKKIDESIHVDVPAFEERTLDFDDNETIPF